MLGNPLLKVQSGAFAGQREGWNTPRVSPGVALFLHEEVVHCLELSLG